MARERRRHVQQDLYGPRGGVRVKNGRAPKISAAPKGKRPVGRPRKGSRAGAPHTVRPELKPRYPVHVVLRVNRAVGSLRKRFMYWALREATIAVAMRELNERESGAFRIVHVSIQRDHVHLICEADHKMALARGMQSFQISAAKHINRAFSRKLEERRRGNVFADRYHMEIIETPKQARHTLSYVLNNWRKHREDRGDEQRRWLVDPFSTGVYFNGWKELEGAAFFWKVRDTYEPMAVYLPKTWLLREGWRRHGLIRTNEVPSARTVLAHADH